MGTNYYLHEKKECECCGREFEPIHIGKSSSGWCFSLHVIPDDGINSLDDWRALWSRPGAYIRNEYGERVSVDDMEKFITQRSGVRDFDSDLWWGRSFYRSEQDFLDRNQCQRGPNGLLRHRIGAHCLGHGDGTWDYISGDFS